MKTKRFESQSGLLQPLPLDAVWMLTAGGAHDRRAEASPTLNPTLQSIRGPQLKLDKRKK